MFLVVLVACLAISSTGEAQIYSWVDANGTMAVSNEPLSPKARTLVAGGTTSMGTPMTASPDGAGRYDALIRRHALNYGVRADLVRAVIQVEFGFNPRARSPKGAVGLMQLMPTTAVAFGVADRYDPAENIRGGGACLDPLLRQYEGNEEPVLAAYNAGPQAVERYGNDVPPYRETAGLRAQNQNGRGDHDHGVQSPDLQVARHRERLPHPAVLQRHTTRQRASHDRRARVALRIQD